LIAPPQDKALRKRLLKPENPKTQKKNSRSIEASKFVCAAAAFGNETLSGQQLFGQEPIYHLPIGRTRLTNCLTGSLCS